MIGRIKEVNGEKKIEWIAGRAEGQGVPIGCIMAIYGNTAPNSSWLICDGSTFDAETYPALALYLGGNRLPDLRECVLVGAGQSDNDYDASTNPNGIHEHDVYTVGQFKDDQFQGHKHDSGMGGHGGSGYPLGTNTREWTFTTDGPVSDGTNGTPRTGKTTHGKQVGVNYIIKATSVSAETDHAAILAQAMAYMRDQNELSDLEVLQTYSERYLNTFFPYTMPYDGILYLTYNSSVNREMYLDNTELGRLSGNQTITLNTINARKGQIFSLSVLTGEPWWGLSVQFFKKRDYSNR